MTPKPKQFAATVRDLPPIIEQMAQVARNMVYRDPYPEPLSVDAIRRLLPDEVVHVTGKDGDGASRTLAGPVLACTEGKITILNVLTAMYTGPEKEIIRFTTGIHQEPVPTWHGIPCAIRHPSGKTLTTVERLIVEKKQYGIPEETVKEKKQKMKELTPRDIALGLLRVVTRGEAKGRGQLCREAGIEVAKEVATQVLQALAQAGKVEKVVEVKDGLKIIKWKAS
jgi:hypothetical protein